MIARFAQSLALVSAAALSAQAISTLSIDTFDSDNEGWRVGGAGVQPSFNGGVSFDGQPGFLSHFSDGGGPNGKWLMLSDESDWTGDYTAAGVGGVSLWADGRTGDDTVLWLGFDGPGGWFFTPGQLLVTADDWKRFDFDATADSLIYAAGSGGTGVAADTLSDVTQFEVFAGPGPVSYASRGDLLRGGTSANIIWIDNIAAQPIPEPTTLVGLAALATLTVTHRRR